MAQLGYSDLGNTVTIGGYPATTTPVTTATSPTAPVLSVRAVKTMDGWLGQVMVNVNATIVFESEPYDNSESALQAAHDAVTDAFARLFDTQN